MEHGVCIHHPEDQHALDGGSMPEYSMHEFLSKVLESFILQWPREEVQLLPNQYGGQPGCGPAHFLIEMNDYISTALEDNRAAVIMTSMDFSKAFNRLNHTTCLDEFRKKGASTDLIEIVACFLRGRKMKVKVGEHFSTARNINVGAPQGSVLG